MIRSIAKLLGAACALLFSLPLLHGQTYHFTTLAGRGSIGSTDGTGINARFFNPASIAFNAAGDAYIADFGNHTIRKLAADGTVTTVAGKAGFSGHVDGAGAAARFEQPVALAVDSSGNLFVADQADHVIRKVTPAGVVTTFAGQPGVAGSADGTGGAAQFNAPAGLAFDKSGTLYVSDSRNDTIRKITPAGAVSTWVGQAGSAAHADGTGAAARFGYTGPLAFDTSGNLIVSDAVYTGNSRTTFIEYSVRSVSPAGAVSTALDEHAVLEGAGVDSLSSAVYTGIAVDSANTIYLSDGYRESVRKLAASGVAAIAGADSPSGNSEGGFADGTGTAARFAGPSGLAVDPSGNILVADVHNNAIRRITPAGNVTTIAGTSPAAAKTSTDGAGDAARLGTPTAVAVDSHGNAYVADANDYGIRRVTPDGLVTLLAGGTPGTKPFFNPVSAIAIDPSDNVIIAITQGILRITPSGLVSTVAGQQGNGAYKDGDASVALFGQIAALAVDRSGNIFVADPDNRAIRKITPAGVVSTVVGGSLNPSALSSPSALAVAPNGDFYVVDRGNTILHLTAGGAVTTLAGPSTANLPAGATSTAAYVDGPGSTALFNHPASLVLDASGNLYAVDNENNAIRKITPDGFVTTVAGPDLITASALSDVPAGNMDGDYHTVRFNRPSGLAIDSAGNLYVADSGNAELRVGRLAPIDTRIVNFSVLAFVAGGSDGLTVGTITGGSGTTGPTPVLARAAGPSLANFGVGGALADPQLDRYVGPAHAANNNDWGGGADLAATFQRVGAFPFAASSKDAALLTSISTGDNTTFGATSTTSAGGQVLLELYDATDRNAITATTPRLLNVSALKQIGSAGLTAGFVVAGSSAKTVLVRGVGPSLAAFGVGAPLDNPVISLFGPQGNLLATNDDWGIANPSPVLPSPLRQAFALVNAFVLTSPLDAALLIDLEPGNYTVQLRSATGATGTALIEVYEVP